MLEHNKHIAEETLNSILILSNQRLVWICKTIRENCGVEFRLDEVNESPDLDVCIAIVSMATQVMKNKFNHEKFEDVQVYILGILDSLDKTGHAKIRFEEYKQALKNSIETPMSYRTPFDAVSELLIHKLLGKNVDEQLVELNGSKTKHISPIVVQQMSLCLVEIFKIWRESVFEKLLDAK